MVVLDEYHKKEMMEKKLDKIKMMNCDICHDRPNPSSCNNNNNNKNKNKYMGNNGVRMVKTARALMLIVMTMRKKRNIKTSVFIRRRKRLVMNCM
jgi:hypothetical protein